MSAAIARFSSHTIVTNPPSTWARPPDPREPVSRPGVALCQEHTRVCATPHEPDGDGLRSPGDAVGVTMPDDPRRYMQIAAFVRQGLAERRWEPGQPVPSITTLSQEYGVNRRTAAKALALLESEGLLTRIPGLGYYVNSQPPSEAR